MFIPRPTRGGLLFLLAAASALGAAIMNVGLISALIASLLWAMLLSGFLLSILTVTGCKVVRGKTAEGCCLDEISLPVTVQNTFPFYRQSWVVQEKIPFSGQKKESWEIPMPGPRASILLERRFTALKRGHFHLNKIYLTGGDPAGLFKVTRVFRIPCEVMITPKVRLLGKLSIENASGLSLSHDGRSLGHAGLGSDFYGVRPYRQGDEMRSIHWRLSVAKQRLLVREYEATAMDHVVLILDTFQKSIGFDPVENNFEALISLAASISASLSKSFCLLDFITTYGKQGVVQLSGDAAGIRLRIQELLTELAPSGNKIENLLSDILETLPEGSVVYLLTMSESPELKKMLPLLEDLNIQLQWVCAAKEYFPFVETDEPMVAVLPPPEKRYPAVSGPQLLTFQTEWEGLFQNESGQK